MTLAIETLVFGVHQATVNPQVVHNALIEWALVNARVLAYFVSKPRRKREVTAYDFLSESLWDHRGAEPDVGRLIGLVSNHLTHAMHVRTAWFVGATPHRPQTD